MENIKTVEYTSVDSINDSHDYNQAVLSMTDSVIERLNYAIDNEDVADKEDIEELLNDSVLHEVIDGSKYIIYTCYHLPIIQFSDNDEYMVDNFGYDSLSYELKNNGLSGLHMAMAFWALYADVYERMHEVLSDYEEEEEED